MAEAAKNAETADQLRGEIAELKAQGESDRIDFKLQLAGVRNVKAARALLFDHDNLELCQCTRGLERPRLLATDVPEGASA